MGMYTEIVIKARVKPDVPDLVRSVLRYMFNHAHEPNELPEHEFFSRSRWECIGKSSSYYHIPWENSHYDGDYIFSRSDLKNYDNEIDLFFDWLRPYLDNDEGECIGWKWYESDSQPTLIRK